MVMQTYSYQTVWQDAQTFHWRVSDLIDPDKPLDFACSFLRRRLFPSKTMTPPEATALER